MECDNCPLKEYICAKFQLGYMIFVPFPGTNSGRNTDDQMHLKSKGQMHCLPEFASKGGKTREYQVLKH